MTVAEITRRYRKQNRLTLQGFGQELSMVDGRTFSKQAVSNWENGRANPEFQFLVVCMLRCRDWRRDWAEEVLAILKPELFQPVEISMNP